MRKSTPSRLRILTTLLFVSFVFVAANPVCRQTNDKLHGRFTSRAAARSTASARRHRGVSSGRRSGIAAKNAKCAKALRAGCAFLRLFFLCHLCLSRPILYAVKPTTSCTDALHHGRRHALQHPHDGTGACRLAVGQALPRKTQNAQKHSEPVAHSYDSSFCVICVCRGQSCMPSNQRQVARTLYITGGGTLYSIRTTAPGRVVWP